MTAELQVKVSADDSEFLATLSRDEREFIRRQRTLDNATRDQRAIFVRRERQTQEQITDARRRAAREARELLERQAATERRLQSEARDRQELQNRRLRESARNIAIAFAAATAGVASSVNQFVQYEDALIGVRRTSGLAGEGLQELRERIEGLSTRLGQSQASLLGISQTAAQLGVQGVDNIARFTETIATLNVASDTLQGEAAATALARILTVTNEGFEDVDRFASVIARLGDNFATTEAEIANLTLNIAQASGVFRINSTDAAALGAAFAQIGVQSELARSTLIQFGTSMAEALREGGTELTQLTILTGQTEEQLRETFERSPVEFFQTFLGGLNGVVEAGGDAAQILDTFGLANLRTLPTLTTAARAHEEIGDALNLARTEYTENIKLQEEFALRSEATSFSFDQLRTAINNAQVSLGEFLGPTTVALVNEFTEQVDALRQGFEDLGIIIAGIATIADESFRRLIGSIEGVGAALARTIGLSETADRLAQSAMERRRRFSEFIVPPPTTFEQPDFPLFPAEGIQGPDMNVGDVISPETPDPEEETDRINAAEQRLADLRRERARDAAEQEEEDAAKKREREDEQFEEDIERLTERLTGIDELENQFQGLREIREAQGLQAKARTEDQKRAADEATAKAGIRFSELQTRATIDNLGELFNTSTAVGKAIFLVQKALAIADIARTTQQAANLAYASQLIAGDPSSLARAQVARTSAIIQGVASAAVVAGTVVQEFSGAQQGGVVQGGTFGRDSQPFLLARDEVIVPSRLNPLSQNFDDTFGEDGEGGLGGLGGGQNVTLDVNFINEDAANFLTLQQRENTTLGTQR